MRGTDDHLGWNVDINDLLDGLKGFGAFMRGYWRGNLLWMPWSVLYVSGYEHLKRSTAEGVWTPFEDSEDSRTLRLSACSAASSAAGEI